MHIILRVFLVCIIISSLFYLYLTCVVGTGSLKPLDSTDDTSNNRKKTLAFEAIADLHSQLDEDSNGGVDFAEASIFLRDKLSYPVEHQHQRDLSQDDGIISLLDLWVAWQKNPAHNWTVSETIRWISESVELPEYVATFIELQVDGESLPRLVSRNMTYLSDELGIRNPLHRRKLALKTMDLILFGPPKKNILAASSQGSAGLPALFGLATELPMVLAGLVVASAFVVAFFGLNYHFSRRLRSATSGNYDRLSRAEQTLQELQHELLRLRDVEPPAPLANRNISNSIRRPSNLDDDAFLQHSDSGRSSDQASLMSAKLHRRPDLDSRRPVFPNQRRNGGISRRRSAVTTAATADSPTSPISPVSLNSPAFWMVPPTTASTATSMASVGGGGGFYLGGGSERPSTASARRATTTATPVPADCSASSPSMVNELALWLQLTHELELRNYWEKRSAAAKQLMSAKEACDRVRRKRSTFVGSVRLIHSDNLDDVDSKLNAARRVLENVTSDMHERSCRWSRIEELTGMSLQQPTDIGTLMASLGCSDSTNKSGRFGGSNGAGEMGLGGSCSSPRLFDLSMEFALFGNGFGSGMDDCTGEPHWSPGRSDESARLLDSHHRSMLCGNGSRNPVAEDGSEASSQIQEMCPLNLQQPRPSIPRSNYSFVRPFATIWRRKAKTHAQQHSTSAGNGLPPSPTITTAPAPVTTRLSSLSTSGTSSTLKNATLCSKRETGSHEV